MAVGWGSAAERRTVYKKGRIQSSMRQKTSCAGFIAIEAKQCCTASEQSFSNSGRVALRAVSGKENAFISVDRGKTDIKHDRGKNCARQGAQFFYKFLACSRLGNLLFQRVAQRLRKVYAESQGLVVQCAGQIYGFSYGGGFSSADIIGIVKRHQS